jgi:hypothetical protein
MAMRLIWSGFLLTGLFLIGVSIYERRELRDTGSRYEHGAIHASEDGVPDPTPTPVPRMN